MHDLHSMLFKIPDMLSTSSDNEVNINTKVSITLSLYAIFLPLSFSFLIGTEKVIYFFHIFTNAIDSQGSQVKSLQ